MKPLRRGEDARSDEDGMLGDARWGECHATQGCPDLRVSTHPSATWCVHSYAYYRTRSRLTEAGAYSAPRLLADRVPRHRGHVCYSSRGVGLTKRAHATQHASDGSWPNPPTGTAHPPQRGRRMRETRTREADGGQSSGARHWEATCPFGSWWVRFGCRQGAMTAME